MDKNVTDQTFDLVSSLKHFQEKAKRLEVEVQSLQVDLDNLTNTFNQAVSVYEVDGQQIVITQADVERVRAQLNRSYPEDTVRMLAAVNKLEAMRNLAISDGIVITKPTDLNHWLLTWGIGVFLYALIWLIVLIAGYFVDPLAVLNLEDKLIGFIWFMALAGGIGGVIGVFYSLGYIRMQRQFDFRYMNVVYYLTQPITGMVLSATLFLIVVAGFSIVGDKIEFTTSILALMVMLSWVVGFRQRVFLEMIERAVKNIFSKEKASQSGNSSISANLK